MFFDNLVVNHRTGPLLEETHYYPFGLTKAGISSKAFKPDYSENRKQYNGIEHTEDLDLNQYDAFYRTLDPQLGRWWQIDPKPNDAESPYASMGNNPIRYNDFLGDTIPSQQADNIMKVLLTPKEENKDGDQTGFIRNASEWEYEKDPIKAGFKDFSYSVLGLMGVTLLDDFIQNRINGKNSVGEIALDAAIVATGTVKGERIKGEPIHSTYADGVKVLESNVPPRLGEAIVPKGSPQEGFRNSQLRWDLKNNRIYQAREFNANGVAVRDIDFTSPTFPNGQVRPGHPTPHQHLWIENPTGGSPKRGKPIPFNPLEIK